MASDLISAIGFILSDSWRVLVGIKVPGTDISFAALFVGLFLAVLGIRFLVMIMGFPVDVGQSFNDLEYIRHYTRAGGYIGPNGTPTARNAFNRFRRRD